MVDVSLGRINLELYEEKRRGIVSQQVAWRAVFWIEMIDNATKRVITDRFFLIVASRNYKESPGEHIDVWQEQLDILEVVDLVNERLLSVKAVTWDDFYNQMSSRFIYDPDD